MNRSHTWQHLGVLVLMMTLIGHQSLAQSTPRYHDVLVGLWGAERVFSPAQPIKIVVQLKQNRQMAHTLGTSAHISMVGKEISFSFPHQIGSFRGRRQGKRGNITGHWISEPGITSYSPYASPVTLRPATRDTWEGYVTPIPQTFAIYIRVKRDANGKLSAFLRNPERNQGRYTRIDSIIQSEQDIAFVDGDGETVLSGNYDKESDTLSVFMPGRGGTFDLTRRDRANAPGYYPRRDKAAYNYQPPNDINDGWQVAEPSTVNMDLARLQSLIQNIIATETTSIRTPYIHSVLVARHGKLVLEEYFYGYHADRVHDLRSSTKSVTGVLVGLALDKQAEFDVTTKVNSIFSPNLAPKDALKQQLNVSHLLSMRSGYDCDDNNYESPGNEDRMQEQSEQPDWYRYTLDLPMAHEPGEKAIYCSAGINLLGGVVSKTTATWLPDFFHDNLAAPLQIHQYYMNLDPLKRGYSGGGIHMRPRDFLKIAQLIMDKGKWDGKRVLSAQWVKEMLAPHASIHAPNDYGYTWWRGELPYRDGTVQSFSATGNGGQLLILIPELDIVVGFNGGNYGDFRTWVAWREKLVPHYVLDAITD